MKQMNDNQTDNSNLTNTSTGSILLVDRSETIRTSIGICSTREVRKPQKYLSLNLLPAKCKKKLFDVKKGSVMEVDYKKI